MGVPVYLETLQRINATRRRALPLDEVLRTIAEGAGESLNYVGCLIVIPDASGKRLVLGAVWGKPFIDAALKYAGARVEAFSVPITADQNPMVKAYLTGELQAWSRAPERIVIGIEPTISPKLAPLIERAMGAKLAVCAPLSIGDKILGVLIAFSPREQFPDAERDMLCGLADQAGLAIENARLLNETQRLKRFSENIVQSVAEVILMEDAQGVLTFANPAAATLLGYRDDELLGRHRSVIIAQDQKEAVQQETAKHSRGVASRYETTLLAKNGRLIPAIVSARPLFEEGRFVGVLSAISDITEIKQTERALRESEARFRRLAENAQDIIYRYRLSPRPGIEYISPAVTAITGYSPEEYYADPDLVFKLVHPDDRHLLEKQAQGKIAPGESLTLRWTRKDGALVWIEQRSALVYDDAGNLAAFEGVARDITERKLAEQQLRQRTEELTLVNSITEAINRGASLEEVTRHLAQETWRVFASNGAHLYLLDEDRQTLTMLGLGLPPQIVQQIETLMGMTIPPVRLPMRAMTLYRQVVDSKRALLCNDTEVIKGLVAEYAEGVPMPGNVRALVRRLAPAIYALLNTRGLIVVPLLAEGEVIGIMDMSRATPFSEDDLRRMETIAAPLTAAILRQRAQQALERRADEFAALYETSRDLATQSDLTALLHAIVTRATTLLKSQGGAIFLYDAARGDLAPTISKNFPLPLEVRVKLGEGMAGRVAQTRQPLILDDYSTWAHRIPQAEGIPFRASLDVPMLFQGELIGVLDVSELGDSTRRFTEEDARLLSLFAEQAASAVYNVRVLAEAKERADILAALYDFSRALTDADALASVNQIIVQAAVRIIGVTFARLALLEEEDWVVRAAHPIRVLERDLEVGRREAVAAYPFCQRVLAQNDPVVLHDDSAEIGAAERNALFLGVAETLCLIPLRVGARPLGLLMLGEARQEARTPFSDEKLSLARSLGSQSASAVHRVILREQTESRFRQLQALHAIDMAITSSLDLNVTLEVLLAQVIIQLHADAADVLLLDPRTYTLEFLAGRGFHSRAIERTRAQLGRGHAGRAALERRIVSVPDLHAEPLQRAALLAGEGFCSYYGVPLVAKGNVKGVLEIFHRVPKRADPDWLSLLETLGTQAAIAIDNMQLFNDLQRSNAELALAYDATLEGWARALELRDRETEGHTRRVTEMALALASALGVGDAALVHIRRGALLHDIGKMAIPDAILSNTGRLSDAEQETMRRHPVYAYEMLSPIAYLRPALDIPYCHHERWDGSGYPRGLKGEAIPLAARLFAVVDVWDALCSDRPYRPAWSVQQAVAYMREQSGVQFDPWVVEAFLKLVAEES